MHPPGLRGSDRRLDHHGGRQTTLGHLPPGAHSRRRHPLPEWRRRRRLARRLCRCLPRGLPGHALLPVCHRARGPRGRGGGRFSDRRPATLAARACRGRRVCGAATMTAPLDFVPLWTLILGFGVFMYVLMDGFDLGVGILFGHARGDVSRDLIMNSVAPIWDGNETWLVLGGLALLAAFHSPSPLSCQ